MNSRKALKTVIPYEPPRVPRKHKIRMDLNESMVGCSPRVIEALKKIEYMDVSLYPEYDILARKVARPGQMIITERGRKISTENNTCR